MADTKISALTDAGTLDGTEEMPLVQSSTTKRATAAEVAAVGTKVISVYDLSVNTLDSGNEIEIDVSAYRSISISMYGVTFGSSDAVNMRVSTDGGSTFKSGSTDYEFWRHTDSSTNISQDSSYFVITPGSTSELFFSGVFDGFNNASREVAGRGMLGSASAVFSIFQKTKSIGAAADAIQFYSGSGNAATGGTLVVEGHR